MTCWSFVVEMKMVFLATDEMVPVSFRKALYNSSEHLHCLVKKNMSALSMMEWLSKKLCPLSDVVVAKVLNW